MRLQFELKYSKKLLLTLGLIIVLAVGTLAVLELNLFGSDKDPIPIAVRRQLNFSIVYPQPSSSFVIDQTSYNYQSAQKNLTYSVSINGNKIILSEQPAPNYTQGTSLVYYQSLGLRPVAQIQTKLGLAVLVNFYSQNYAQVGQDAILASSGTLLIARPTQNLTNEAWKNFLNKLNVAQ